MIAYQQNFILGDIVHLFSSYEMRTAPHCPHLHLKHNIRRDSVYLRSLPLTALEKAILNGTDIAHDVVLSKHSPWVEESKTRYEFTQSNTLEILKRENGFVFAQVLEHAGVYRRSNAGMAAFLRFIQQVNREISE